MITLTEKQWESYLDKYKNLIFSIAYKITGDKAICSIEDNVSDLHIAALESINGFNRRTGASFEVMMHMKLFDQYTKTCLWHKKANKGNKIKKRYPLTNNTVSASDNEDLLTKESNAFEGFVEDVRPQLSKIQQDVVDAIVKDPNLLLSNGKINISAVARSIDVNLHKVIGEIAKLNKAIGNIL